MKNKNKVKILSIGACIFFLGIICLVIPRAIKSNGNETRLDKQLTDIERENLEHKWMEDIVVSVLESVDKIQECEADITWSEGEIVRVNLMVTVSAGNIGNDTLKTNIAKNISQFLDISTESITVSFADEDLS